MLDDVDKLSSLQASCDIAAALDKIDAGEDAGEPDEPTGVFANTTLADKSDFEQQLTNNFLGIC